MLLLHDFHVLTQFNHLFYSFLIAIIWTMRASSRMHHASSRMHHREREKGRWKYNNDASSNFLLLKSLFVTAIAMNISMISYCHVGQAIPGRFISSSHIPGRFVSSSPSPHEKCLASSSVKEEPATAEANLPVIGETGSLHSVIAAGSVTQVDIGLHLPVLANVLYYGKVSILVCDVVVLKQLLLQAAVLWCDDACEKAFWWSHVEAAAVLSWRSRKGLFQKVVTTEKAFWSFRFLLKKVKSFVAGYDLIF